MPPIRIEFVEVFERATATLKVFHLCALADANNPLEWWTSKDGKHHALYSQDAYYDEQLRERRQSGMMVCPQDRKQRLVHIGMIYRQVDLEPTSYVEILRGSIALESACVDQK